MVWINAKAGLAELVYTPVMSYLIRSLSGMYAIIGAIFLFVSTDLKRYRELIRFLGGVAVVAGFGLIVLDAVVRLPFLWTVAEGPATMVMGGVMIYLCRSGR
jgi:hypothetical protein